MRKKRDFSKLDLLMLLSVITCVLLIISLGIIAPFLLLPVAIFIIVFSVLVVIRLKYFHKMIANILQDGNYTGVQTNTHKGVAELEISVAAVVNDSVIWYNKAFRQNILSGADIGFINILDILPDFNFDLCESGDNINCKDEMYTIYKNILSTEKQLYFIYLVKDTKLKLTAKEYDDSRPSVMIITVDTYEEILNEMKESDKARITSEIDIALEQFIGSTSGILKRTSASRYLAIVEERHMQEIIKSRFTVLDKVRQITRENGSVSLSIGVGHGGSTLKECESMAIQALDMALGRGGDQAAVKSKDGFTFFGGVLRSVEKNSKVRSRIIANALKELMRQSENIIITGHKNSDLDCVGAAAGIYRMAKTCNKPACIVINQELTMAEKLIYTLKEDGVDFIHPDDAENLIGKNTLLVIVDTHLKALLENPIILEKANNIVIIDHHRRCVGYIEDSVIFYHEPASSSASEMVAELLQYTEFKKDNRLTQVEAEALLSGIMLDTRNFSVHTGVRTFEASAYLRRMGAQTASTKMFFNSSFEQYVNKSKLVESAETFMNCAIVTGDDIDVNLSTVIPQAANDLLTIDGIKASFVAVKVEEQILISARSMGEVNVQVIMEKLGGGGHLTMAGTQMRNINIADAKQALMQSIEEYFVKQENKE